MRHRRIKVKGQSGALSVLTFEAIPFEAPKEP
jgi:hypothetical protein